MSVRPEELGETIIVGVRRPPDAADVERLRRIRPSGVIAFRGMADTVPAWLDAVDRLWRALEPEGIAPLVTIDEEGGFVSQLPAPFIAFPSPMAVARGASEEDAYALARAQGDRLRAMGVTLDYAPCVDVNNERQNPVIGTRAYGTSPAEVIRFARATARGLADAGVAWCPKHFPGHGATTIDSHVGLPRLSRTRAEWEAVDAPPFRALLDAGAPVLMSAHVIVDAIDSEAPATFSRTVLTSMLRQAWGYTGVIVSDDLAMAGAVSMGSPGHRAVAGLSAGCDLLLFAMNPEDAEPALAGAQAALRDGRLDAVALAATLARVRALRARYARRANRSGGGASPEDAPAARTLAQRIASRAITLRGAPLDRADARAPLHLVGEESMVALGDRLRLRGARVLTDGDTPPASVRRVVVISARAAMTEEQAARLARAAAVGAPLVIALTRNPFVLDGRTLPAEATVVETCDDGVTALDALADMLCAPSGARELTGGPTT